MNVVEQASLVSIRAQIARLEAELRVLRSVRWRTPAGRAAILNAMLEISGAVDVLTREARRLEHMLLSDD
jgi:hypothetical protein